MKTVLTILSLLLLHSSCIFAQNLILKKGNRTNKIKSDRFIEIYVNKLSTENKVTCDYQYYYGKIKNISTDSVQMDLIEQQSCFKNNLVGEQKAIFYDKNSDLNSLKWIAKKDVSSVIPSFSREKLKKRNTMSNIAGLIFFAGLGSAASAFLVKNKKDRKQIWIASGIVVGLGITIGPMNTSSDLKTKGEKNIWTIQ